jgi:hypothetical protein
MVNASTTLVASTSTPPEPVYLDLQVQPVNNVDKFFIEWNAETATSCKATSLPPVSGWDNTTKTNVGFEMVTITEGTVFTMTCSNSLYSDFASVVAQYTPVEPVATTTDPLADMSGTEGGSGGGFGIENECFPPEADKYFEGAEDLDRVLKLNIPPTACGINTLLPYFSFENKKTTAYIWTKDSVFLSPTSESDTSSKGLVGHGSSDVVGSFYDLVLGGKKTCFGSHRVILAAIPFKAKGDEEDWIKDPNAYEKLEAYTACAGIASSTASGATTNGITTSDMVRTSQNNSVISDCSDYNYCYNGETGEREPCSGDDYCFR